MENNENTENSAAQDTFATMRELSADDFARNMAWVAAWRAFLNTEAGEALLRVLETQHPLRKLASSAQISGEHLRRAAVLEHSQEAKLLSFCQGYESVKILLTHSLCHLAQGGVRHSKRNGAKSAEVPPHYIQPV